MRERGARLAHLCIVGANATYSSPACDANGSLLLTGTPPQKEGRVRENGKTERNITK